MLGLRKALITGVVSVALVAGGTAAGAAIASGPVDSSGVIHGCWTNAEINGTHVFVLQDAGTSCPRGTTAISWNQAGQQGPAGPAGPAGTVGATGPAGPAGPIGITGAAGPVGAPGPTAPAGPQGPIGNTGPPGPAGANGNTVLNGTGAPPASVGNDGDFYIDTAADVLYGPKAGGSWPATGTSLVGAPGATGPAGPAGPTGPAGAGGNLDSLNGQPCDTGTAQAGTLAVTYTPQPDGTDSISLVCDQTAPAYGLTVHFAVDTSAGLSGLVGVMSDFPVAGIQCSVDGTGATTGSCSHDYPVGTTLTLTVDADNATGSWGFDPTTCDSKPTDFECTVTVNAQRTVVVDWQP